MPSIRNEKFCKALLAPMNSEGSVGGHWPMHTANPLIHTGTAIKRLAKRVWDNRVVTRQIPTFTAWSIIKSSTSHSPYHAERILSCCRQQNGNQTVKGKKVFLELLTQNTHNASRHNITCIPSIKAVNLKQQQKCCVFSISKGFQHLLGVLSKAERLPGGRRKNL